MDSSTNRTRVDIELGFHVEQPALFVLWGIPEEELRKMLGAEAKSVAHGYLTC